MKKGKRSTLKEKRRKVDAQLDALDAQLKTDCDRVVADAYKQVRRARFDAAVERRRIDRIQEEKDLLDRIATSPHGAQMRELKLVDQVRRYFKSPYPRVHP